MRDRELGEAMKESLSEGLSRSRDRMVRVVEFTRAPFAGSSSFATGLVTVELDTGERLDVFHKDLNPLHQLWDARLVRQIGLSRSRRELWMYTDVLDAQRLWTPELLGHRWEVNTGWLWLFLEHVGPKRLSRLGDFPAWLAAARWLGSFHATMRFHRPTAASRLVDIDMASLTQEAHDLARDLGRIPSHKGDVIRRAVDLCDSLDGRIRELPQGLTHGEFFGKNVVMRVTDPSRPVAVIDWETAALGPLYFDLADISAGRWSRRQRLDMWTSYLDGRVSVGGDRPVWASFCHEVEIASLARSLGWLASWKRGDEAHISRWVAEVETTLGQVERTDRAAA